MNLERIITEVDNYLNQFDNSRLEENPLQYVWKARFEIFKTEPESIDPPYFKIGNTTELKELITKVFPLESPSRISEWISL